jgi:short subunit dehydrogenase-like uncharacterized protein
MVLIAAPACQKFGEIGDAFNDFSTRFTAATLPTAGDEAVKVRVTVDIWLYGDNAAKQRDWSALAARSGQKWGAVQWATLSADPPVIVGDLRAGRGGLTTNPAALGHELLHVMRLADSRVADPDLMAQKDKDGR